MAGKKPSSPSSFLIGNCKVEVEGSDFSYESNRSSLRISVSEAAKITVSGNVLEYLRLRNPVTVVWHWDKQGWHVRNVIHQRNQAATSIHDSYPWAKGDSPSEDYYFLLVNPKDVDGRSKLLLKEVLDLYKKELPMMNYAANTGKQSVFLERSVSNGKYRTLLLKSRATIESGEIIAAVSYQIIPADTQYAEIPLAAVSSSYQHKGIGHLMYIELKKRLQNVGVSTIFCWGDKESEGFWFKQGFVSIAEVDTKGRARRLPIKADIRRALCFPGGSTLMVSHLPRESGIPFISPKHVEPHFLRVHTISPSSGSFETPNLVEVRECLITPKIDISKEDDVLKPITNQVEVPQDLANDECSADVRKVEGLSPINDGIHGCTDLIPWDGVEHNNVVSDLGSAENESSPDGKYCSCSGQGAKRRVWESSLSSLKSKKVKGGHHIDCYLDSNRDLLHNNDCTSNSDFGGCSLDDKYLEKVAPPHISCQKIHAEENRHIRITSTEDCVGQGPHLEGRHPVIMLMNIADDNKKACLTRIIEELGGVVTSEGSDSTHVVTGKARRTLNFCSALCSGAWMVSSKWLKASFREGRFVGEAPFVLKDEDYVLKYRLELNDAVFRAKARPHALLKGYDICLAKHIQPPVSILTAIVKSAGGNVLCGLDKVQEPSRAIYVACEIDMEEALAAAKKGVWTYTSDWFMNCIMRQELDLEAPQFAESL